MEMFSSLKLALNLYLIRMYLMLKGIFMLQENQGVYISIFGIGSDSDSVQNITFVLACYALKLHRDSFTQLDNYKT